MAAVVVNGPSAGASARTGPVVMRSKRRACISSSTISVVRPDRMASATHVSRWLRSTVRLAASNDPCTADSCFITSTQ